MNNGLLKSEWEVLREQMKNEKVVLKELEKHYSAVLDDIETRIASMLGRNDAELPHVIRRIEYQRMIKAQLQSLLDKLHANEYETISEYLNDSYTTGFVGTVYTLHEQEVPVIVPIDQNVAVKAVTIDSKLKEDLYKTLGTDMTKLKKTIAAEITRGIASGMTYGDIARNIKNASGIPFRRARTIVRTEAGRVQEQAAMDAGIKAKQVGADVVKQWSAIRDGKTRPQHRQMNRQVREMDERFSNGLMFPQEPGGKAEEVINCRCTLLIRAREEMDEEELRIMQEHAKFFKLDKTKGFEDFKKKYLKAAETVENTGKSGIINTKQATRKIKDGTTVVNPMDASKYAELKTNLQKKGVTVMQAKDDDLAFMQVFGAEATYAGGYIMHIGEIPSASALYEEIIHWTQAVKYGELTSTDPVELCAREVAANRKLLRNGYAYGFDDVDFEDIERNLATWETKFEELVGVTYDESDYRRDV